MPFAKIILPEVNRKFAIRFSTPTEDICTLEAFHKFFSSEAAYNIIPGFENTSIVDVETYLLQVMPFTTNSILDITLPYIEVTKKKNVIKHLARYLIVDRVLYGIRIKISDNWPKSRTIKQPISANLQHFYDQYRITNYPQQIVVGQFILATPHFKLAPLFSSELSSLLDNTTFNLLNDYYNLGCEIFSLVNDITEEKKKTLKQQFFIQIRPFDLLKNYRRDTTVFVCSGMYLNADSLDIYKSKSYAIQTADRLKKIHVTQLDEVYTENFIVDLNQTKKVKKTALFDDSKIIHSDIEIVDCKKVRIQHFYDKIDFHAIGRFESPMEIEEEQNEVKIKENEILMYLWNLYVKFNNRTPFILPLPMNRKDELLMSKILELQQFSSLKKSDLVKFMKLDPKTKLAKKYEIHNFKTISLDKLIVNDGQQLPVYFSLKEKLLANSIEKDDRFLEEVQKKVINYLGCINEEMLRAIQNESVAQKVQVLDEDQKFIEKFLKRKNMTLEMFYFEMARYYQRGKLTNEFIQTMYESLKVLTKRQVTGSPFQAFILKTSFADVRHIFIESEQKFFAKDILSIKNEEQPSGELAQTQQNNFRQHLKKVNYYVFNQKKSTFSCHICLALVNKKLQGLPYGRMCLGCSNFVCYSCLDKKTGETAQSQQQLQQCLVCQNKCDCEKCMKKRYKNHGINDYANPPRMSLFRSSNNLNNSSNENIRINEEEMIPNESKSQLFGTIKSETSQKFANKNPLLRDSSAAQEQKIPIQRCWTCELQNRLERVIKFECDECKSEKCFDCEKAENPKRAWVLRFKTLCNNCHNKENESIFKQAENKNLKSKIIALQHDIMMLKRKSLFTQASSVQNNNQFGDYAIVQEFQEHEEENNYQNKEKGSATPIFDRSNMGIRGNQSPISLNGRKNSEEMGSNASFGGDNKNSEIKNQNEPKRRKNSSKSSGSGSEKSKKSQVAKGKNEIKQTTSKRKNSSGSQKSSIASFQKKPNRQRSNSRSSARSSAKNSRKGRNSSAQSGQYQQSSSEHLKKKPQWKKNHHENTDQPNSFQNNRGGNRPRGERGGRGGNRQGGDFNKWDNNRGQGRDFRGKNDDRRDSNNRFNNNDRQGGFNSGGQKGRNYDANRNYQDRNDRNYDSNNYNDSRNNNNDSRDDNTTKNDSKKDGLLFVSNKTSINDEDMDY